MYKIFTIKFFKRVHWAILEFKEIEKALLRVGADICNTNI